MAPNGARIAQRQMAVQIDDGHVPDDLGGTYAQKPGPDGRSAVQRSARWAGIDRSSLVRRRRDAAVQAAPSTGTTSISATG
jgi:hypothetical protein